MSTYDSSLATASPGVLVVDDEPSTLTLLGQLFRSQFPVFRASGGVEALEVLEREDVGVVVADQRMPQMTGTELLSHVMERKPDVVRILLTAYTDVDTLKEAINAGKVYQYITKPWDNHDLQIAVRAAMETFTLRRHNADLLAELQAANAQLAKLDRMKSGFIAIASHELRTPLNAILGYASLLHDKMGDKAAGQFASRLIDSAVHMRNLIEVLTNLRYLEGGYAPMRREHLDLRQLLIDARQDMLRLAESRWQRLIVENDPAPVPVDVDRTRCMVVLTNLLTNAVTFTPPSGEIRLRAFTRSGEAWVQVQDNGPGLPPGEEETIFERFYQVEHHMTRKHGGMGLGLSIARATVELHEGRIFAQSAGLGKGTTVTVVLPLATDAARGLPTPASPVARQ